SGCRGGDGGALACAHRRAPGAALPGRDPRLTDLAVVGMDPRFGGGSRVLTQAFAAAAEELGRAPELHYFEAPGLAGVEHGSRRAPFRRFDAGNQLAAGRRMAPGLRTAESVWVVSALAPYGYPAVRSGRPYACWLATGLEDE